MAFAEHRKLQIKQSDKVIISATPIPGNEVIVSRVINQLYRCGAEVIYEVLAEVHVSGHACQEELKLMHTLVKPKYFIPVHGEYRMLWQHAELAESLGTPRENIVLPETGQIIAMNDESMSLEGIVPTGTILIDGLGIGDVGNMVLRDRKHLSQEGLIIVAMAFDRTHDTLISGPDIISAGLFLSVRMRISSRIHARWSAALLTPMSTSQVQTGLLSRTVSRMSCAVSSMTRSSETP